MVVGQDDPKRLGHLPRHHNCGARADSRLDLEGAWQALCAFAHADQPESSPLPGGLIHIEAVAVVADHKPPPAVRRPPQLNFATLRVPMSGRVPNSLANDAKQRVPLVLIGGDGIVYVQLEGYAEPVSDLSRSRWTL
jgi:hypothetical protein